jgi:polypeptide N-acetylgalactosaminyltransferase
MRLFLLRRLSLLKLALAGGTLFMVVLVILQKDVGISSNSVQDPWFQDLVERKERVLVMVRGAVNNLGFQVPL